MIYLVTEHNLSGLFIGYAKEYPYVTNTEVQYLVFVLYLIGCSKV